MYEIPIVNMMILRVDSGSLWFCELLQLRTDRRSRSGVQWCPLSGSAFWFGRCPSGCTLVTIQYPSKRIAVISQVVTQLLDPFPDVYVERVS